MTPSHDADILWEMLVERAYQLREAERVLQEQGLVKFDVEIEGEV